MIIKKITLHRQVKWVQVSSNINEIIRVILNLFIFFLQEDFTHTKSTKSIQANEKKKTAFLWA